MIYETKILRVSNDRFEVWVIANDKAVGFIVCENGQEAEMTEVNLREILEN